MTALLKTIAIWWLTISSHLHYMDHYPAPSPPRSYEYNHRSVPLSSSQMIEIMLEDVSSLHDLHSYETMWLSIMSSDIIHKGWLRSGAAYICRNWLLLEYKTGYKCPFMPLYRGQGSVSTTTPGPICSIYCSHLSRAHPGYIEPRCLYLNIVIISILFGFVLGV